MQTPIPPLGGRAEAWADCRGPGKRVCMVPVGLVEKPILDGVIGFFQDTYGLEIHLGPSMTLPPGRVVSSDSRHAHQEDAGLLWQYMMILQTRAGFWDEALDGALVIGVTSADMYLESQPKLNFVFGQRYDYPISRRIDAHGAIVSYGRMDDGLRGREERIKARLEKMIGKYIGLYYFGLPLSNDPSSAMYDQINGISDLDRMSDRLPLPGR